MFNGIVSANLGKSLNRAVLPLVSGCHIALRRDTPAETCFLASAQIYLIILNLNLKAWNSLQRL